MCEIPSDKIRFRTFSPQKSPYIISSNLNAGLMFITLMFNGIFLGGALYYSTVSVVRCRRTARKMFLCRIILFHRTLHKYVLNIFPVSKKLDEDLMKYYLLPDYDNKVLLWLMKTFHPEEQLILIYRLVFPNFYYFQTMKDLCLVLDSELFSPFVFTLFALALAL